MGNRSRWGRARSGSSASERPWPSSRSEHRMTMLPTADVAVWYVFYALGNFASLSEFGVGQVIARVYSYLWAGAEDFDAEGLRPPPQSREPNLRRIRQLSETVRSFYLYLSLG